MKGRPIIFVCLIYASALMGTAFPGDINGHILITKTLTKKRVTLPSYQLRDVSLPLQHEDSFSFDELSRLAVYLEGPTLDSGTPISAKLIQQNIRFDPEILIIPAGSTVSFPNSDPIFHNVFSLSKLKQFDLGYYPAGQSRTVKFDKAGVVQVYCHLHPHMNAAILVVQSAWYTRPGKDGNFSFSGIPAGTYQIAAWHKSAGFFKRRIALPDTGSIMVDFTIPIRETGQAE
jgi:plastocyanin